MNQALNRALAQAADTASPLDLLSTQHGIFLADHLSPIEDLYTIAHCLELPKTLDLSAFKQAIQIGLNEADTVTAHYSQDAAEATFQVQAHRDIRIEEFNFCHLTPEQAQQRVWDWMPTDRQHAKSLKSTGSCLYRQALFITHDTVYWYQRYHHIMLDGFSLIQLTKRIIEIYQRLTTQQEVGTSPFIAVQEVIAERKAYEQSEQFQRDQAFWQSYCQSLATPVSLSTHHLAAKTTAQFIKHQLHFSSGILQHLQTQAATEKLALPDVLMALSLHYLHRMTDKSALVLGVPFMRRLGSKALRSPIPTVNVLPVQFNVHAEDSLFSLAHHVQAQLKLVRPHQKYDAEQILRDLNAIDVHERIYGAILNYKTFDQDLTVEGEAVKTQHISTGPIDDFEFSFIVQNQQLIIELRADALRYSQAELIAHGQRLTLLLEQCLAQPLHAVTHFNLCTAQELEDLSLAATGPRIAHPEKYNNILDIFYEQAAQYPDRIAIVSGERDALQQLTFAELSIRINQFTRFLKSCGARQNTVIAGAIPRSVDSVIVMLSVLNSGASFLPLDLDYPIDRMQMMSEDANPLFVLTTQALTEKLPENLNKLYLDDADVQHAIATQDPAPILAEERQFNFQDVAYVIFTSGSTGRPKGVMNTHGSLVNLILSHQHTIYMPVLEAVKRAFPDRPLRAAHTHSFSFDSSWLQVFWLLWGQELHIFDEDMRRDAWGLVQEIQHRQIDTLDLPPSFCAQMISNGLFAADQHHPRLILIGGEAAPLALWQQLNAQEQLFAHNLYGPTEYTVDTFRAELKKTERPVIGNPIGNTQAYVLDPQLQRCATGVIGELYISGYGIANGYLGRADLSSTRFVANPFEDGQRMYRTGDLVRWNMAGKLEFMGRCDDQIKIRGYRVEIGEVENALSILPDIESAVVIAEPINNSHRLLGYCVVKDIQLDEQKSQQLSEHYLHLLKQNLPEYMVPSALTVMQEFPRNVSGKVDKKALPRPQVRSQSRVAENAEQQLLCDLTASILKLDKIGIDDDFFMTGGDSISAIMLCTALRQQQWALKPSDVFQLKTISAMAQQLQRIDSDKTQPLKAMFSPTLTQQVQQHYAQEMTLLPLLPLHKGMLFHAQLDTQQHYNAFTRLSLHGDIDATRIEHALTAVLQRHPQLAGCFDQQFDDALFVYAPKPQQAWKVQHVQCSAEQLESTVTAYLEQPMALDQPYGLMRAVLVQHTEQDAEFLIIVHHLLTDGWSTPLFLKDFIQAYQHPAQALPALTHSYASVIQQLDQRNHQASKDIWQHDLADVQPLILFPQSRPQSVLEHSLTLNPQLSAQLQQTLRQRGITLNVFMQMIWAMTLHLHAHREDIIFGTPVAGRSAPIEGIEEQIGLFLNTLPVRVQLNMQVDLWQQLDALQQLHMRHLEHDGLGLGEIQQLHGQGNLFDSLLVVENYPDQAYLQQSLGETKIQHMTNRGYSHYPLALLVIPQTSGIELLLEQRHVIANPEQFLQRIEQSIMMALDVPELALSQYPLLLPAEKQQLQRINQTDYPVPHTTLQQLLYTQAQRTPTALALLDDQHQLTYQAVRQQVCALAQKLQNMGVQAGDVVAVALPRSAKLSVAILAIIEAGGAYLPLDLNLPTERLHFMLQDAQCRALISTSAATLQSDLPTLYFADLFHTDDIDLSNYHTTVISPQHPAYVIYTSGTTGKPKGVMVSHQAIVNRILWMQAEYPLQATDTILQKTPCSFDVSVWEFFWSYLVGARLAMAPVDAHRDPLLLLKSIEQYQVTTLHFVPSMLAIFEKACLELMSEEQRQNLSIQQVFCSGEALATSLAQSFSQHFNCALHNLYGPTEAAVDVSYLNAREQLNPNEVSVSIGAPVWNTQLYILDQYLRPVPNDIEGELYLAGDQLAMGYLQRPDLTATRFVANPFVQGQRMYRTGDIARWNSNGTVQYVGRSDDQLKIRGQRIELGEIEQHLKQLSGVKDVVVHAHHSQNQADVQLIAYFKSSENLAIAQLKQQLAQRLPVYMLPQHYICVPNFPLSHNGKLDRKALPLPKQDVNSAKRLPETALEQQLADIFATLLNCEHSIGVDDDFFALGGHSILVMKLVIEIRKRFNRSLAMSSLMSNVSIARLAALLNDDGDTANGTQAEQVLQIRQGQDLPPVFCFFPGSGYAWQYTVLKRYLHPDLPIIALQSPRPHGVLVNSQNMDELIEQQLKIIRQQQATGPYTLLGYSFGGTLAFALASRLQQQGETVRYLGLLDTYPAEIHQWQAMSVEEETAEAEQEQFFADILHHADPALIEETQRLQQDIFDNYRDAVRLLKPYRMPKFNGNLHLVVAERDLLAYIQPEQQWQPLVNNLHIDRLADASHSTILSPQQLTILGPLLNQAICQACDLQVIAP